MLWDGNYQDYYMQAKEEDCVLLPEEVRSLKNGRHLWRKNGGMVLDRHWFGMQEMKMQSHI